MKCPFCWKLEPTWDHVQACGIRARMEQEKRRRRERKEIERRLGEEAERDKRNGTWHGWGVAR